MKVSVRVRGEWFAVPCRDGRNTIGWLAEDALRRYLKLKPSTIVVGREERVFEVRKTQGGAILDPDDTIRDVLNDEDFVSVVLDSDRPNPEMEPAEIHYVPEQVPGLFTEPQEYLSLDGNSLSTDDLLNLGNNRYKIRLTIEAESKVSKGREVVERLLKENKAVYGITTGFGSFARTAIDKEKLCELQENLIRSHAAGVGKPLSPKKTRMLMALRINVLSKGYSGISLETVKQLIDAFNVSCLSWVPEKGTVGASGDLCPLAHLALGTMGEGKMWSPRTGWGDAKYVLESHNLVPVQLKPKEGIAMINGTQLITALGAEAVERSGIIARQADVVAALSLEVLKGSSKAFDEAIHKARPHRGQMLVARRLRALLHSRANPSQIAESHRFCNRVQDAYTLRCCPQVHGIVHDTIDFVRGIITTEMNSATDNPEYLPRYFFLKNDRCQLVFTEKGETISAGNFHGEYPAKALDYLAIGVHELASMSERRIERLVNPALSELPAFLVKDGGLNSGFMMAHVTAASLVSENKVLCHPSSVDSLSTSAGTEDHVSMGGFSARKALHVVENVEHVVAIELLAACQAIEFLRPLKTTSPLEEVCKVVRSVVRPWDKDRYMSTDIYEATQLLRDEKVWLAVKHHVEHYFSATEVPDEVFSPTSFRVAGPSGSNGGLPQSTTTATPPSPILGKRRRTTSYNQNGGGQAYGQRK